MSDQLRDVMTRIAERAEPLPPDPTLWSRARRARRRGDLVTATAVGAAVFALAATVGVLVQPDPDRPDLVPRPTAGHPDHRPRRLRRRDLQLETTSPSVPPPSRSPTRPARSSSPPTTASTTGSTCPASTRPCTTTPKCVAPAWSDSACPRTEPGWPSAGTRRCPTKPVRRRGFVRSGLRILDLQRARSRTCPRTANPPAEFGAAIDNQDFPWGRVPYGMRWSPDGRYLAYEQVWAAAPPGGSHGRALGQGLQEAYRQAASPPARRSTTPRPAAASDVQETGSNPSGFWLSGIWAWTAGPDGGRRRQVANVSVNNTVEVALGGRISTVIPLPGRDSPRRPHRRSLRRSWQGHRRDPGAEQPSARRRPPHRCPGATGAPLTPVHVDLLGWIGRDHAMAQVRTGLPSRTSSCSTCPTRRSRRTWSHPSMTRAPDSTFSFATDFATVRHPATDFTDATESDDGAADSPSGRRRHRVGGDGPGATWLAAVWPAGWPRQASPSWRCAAGSRPPRSCRPVHNAAATVSRPRSRSRSRRPLCRRPPSTATTVPRPKVSCWTLISARAESGSSTTPSASARWYGAKGSPTKQWH